MNGHYIELKIDEEEKSLEPIELDNIIHQRIVSFANGTHFLCTFNLSSTVIQARIYPNTPISSLVKTTMASNYQQIIVGSSQVNHHYLRDTSSNFIAFGASHVDISLIDELVSQEVWFLWRVYL